MRHEKRNRDKNSPPFITGSPGSSSTITNTISISNGGGYVLGETSSPQSRCTRVLVLVLVVVLLVLDSQASCFASICTTQIVPKACSAANSQWYKRSPTRCILKFAQECPPRCAPTDSTGTNTRTLSFQDRGFRIMDEEKQPLHEQHDQGSLENILATCRATIHARIAVTSPGFEKQESETAGSSYRLGKGEASEDEEAYSE
eukprot:2016830-Rhodomonas_salina.1